MKRLIIEIFIVILFVASAFTAGLRIGQTNAITNYPSENGGLNSDQLATLNQVWNAVNDRYLDQPIDQEQLLRGAMKGIMSSLGDPYSAYMTPEEVKAQDAPLKGGYTGIGAWVDTSGEKLVIISPMPGSPAEKAGLLAGDVIEAIDGEDMTGIKPDEVLTKLLGPAGTSVQISVRREGLNDLIIIRITRAEIPIPSVESDFLKERFAYIRIYSFGEDTAKDTRIALEQLIADGAKGIILDLRNNSGGYVDTAIAVTSLFLDDKIVLIEEWAGNKRKEYKSKGTPLVPDLPLVVLVNQGTASAAEITAGALQDNGRATLVGTSTYGKGYIQSLVPVREQNGALKISIARWLTPSGEQIEGSGLWPNYYIDFTQDQIVENIDVQLDQAEIIINWQIESALIVN